MLPAWNVPGKFRPAQARAGLFCMHFLLGSKGSEVPGPEVTVDCLWCGKTGMAQSRKLTEWLTLFHLLPLIPFRTVFVRCDKCGKDMVAKCSLEELAQSNPLTLKHLLSRRVSLVGRVCIVLGVLLCWAPLVGVIPATIGFFYRRASGPWMRRLSIFGFVVSVFITSSLLLLGILVKFLGPPAK